MKPNSRENRVERYLQQALAPNTVSAYVADLRHFRAWGGRVPAKPETVARYIADCADQMKASTLSRRLAAIRHAHVEAGRESPTGSAVVQRTLRGIRRVHGSAVKQAAPVTVAMLRELVKPRDDMHPVRDLRDRSLLLLGFAGGFRRSELVSLRPCDIKITREGMHIHLRHSKTDAAGKGRAVAVSRGKGRMCPVRSLLRWLAVLKREEPEGFTSQIFRSVRRQGRLGGGLTPASVNDILKERLQRCRLPLDGYSAHSLRAGFVTSAAMSGVPIWAIQRQTGHRSPSTVHRYIRPEYAGGALVFGRRCESWIENLRAGVLISI